MSVCLSVCSDAPQCISAYRKRWSFTGTYLICFFQFYTEEFSFDRVSEHRGHPVWPVIQTEFILVFQEPDEQNSVDSHLKQRESSKTKFFSSDSWSRAYTWFTFWKLVDVHNLPLLHLCPSKHLMHFDTCPRSTTLVTHQWEQEQDKLQLTTSPTKFSNSRTSVVMHVSD